MIQTSADAVSWPEGSCLPLEAAISFKMSAAFSFCPAASRYRSDSGNTCNVTTFGIKNSILSRNLRDKDVGKARFLWNGSLPDGSSGTP